MENQRSSDGASSSSTAAVDKYDVFINHRGELKKSFAGHLYRALHLRGLRPFLDRQDLQEGLTFPSQLEAVIRNASVHVAVFSPKYAESPWCLDELLLMRQSGAPIIPVFYQIKPADLRRTAHNKTKGYGLSLHQLEKEKGYDPATIQKWRDALSFVAEISGFDLDDKYDGDEVHMIDEIVERVRKMITKPGWYVFINHRGEVKKSFAGHLYRALHLRGLRPFLDEKDLQEGLPFPSQLEDVIRNASVHVAVFSPKYAESCWCLDELLLMRQSGAPIIPVFYHVKPADLRSIECLRYYELKRTLDPQTGEAKLRYDPATIQEWRDALSSVADISGFDLDKYDGSEVHMIDEIVERVDKIIRKLV